MWLLLILIVLFIGFIFIVPPLSSPNDRIGENEICRYCGSRVEFFIRHDDGSLIIWCNNCNKETYTVEDNRIEQ